MKTVLLLFEKLSSTQRRGLGHTSLKLAERLFAGDMLEQVICLDLDRRDDIFDGRAEVFLRHRWWRLAYMLSGRLGRLIPGLKIRLFHEFLFDQFARSRIRCGEGTLLFVSRPLFDRTIRQVKAAGRQVWIQSSVAHPLFNQALVRNEELRLGLKAQGPYSDPVRAQKMARTILLADRLVTLDPEVGRFTFESYQGFIDPHRLLPLRDYFSIDLDEFAELAHGRRPKADREEVVFFHLSHINLIKGVQILLAAWQKLQASGVKNCRLQIGGHVDFNMQQVINRQYPGLRNVEFLGFVPSLADLLGKVDVFVSPSISDAGPATMLETMSAGLPVIASRNCGFASLVTDGDNGFTYPYNDVQRLTDILAWFDDHPDRILPMGRQARARMEGLSTGRYAEEILRHIKGLDICD